MIFGTIHIPAIQNIFLKCSCRAKLEVFSKLKTGHIKIPVGDFLFKSLIVSRGRGCQRPWIGYIYMSSKLEAQSSLLVLFGNLCTAVSRYDGVKSLRRL
jgi:hypothetical protein